ncbi:MAG: hypothetical protein WCD00_00500 [Desulfuromonadaceae bacterium]
MNYTELLNPRNSAVMVFGVAGEGTLRRLRPGGGVRLHHGARRAALWVRGIGCDCFAF